MMCPLCVVLDTNVMISAILFGGPPKRVLEHAICGAIEMAVSLDIILEVQDVLRRPKFGFSAEATAEIIRELQEISTLTYPTKKLNVVATDPDDNRIIECAVESNASVIISGDSDLLNLGEYGKIRILSPVDFLNTFNF
jgi:putative PIN family toxin of toxin-antitoxin system